MIRIDDCIQKLESVGFTKPQAKAQMDIIEGYIPQHFATKQDFLRLEEKLVRFQAEVMATLNNHSQRFVEIDRRFVENEQKFVIIDQRFAKIEREIGEIKLALKNLEFRLLLKMGALFAGLGILFKYILP